MQILPHAGDALTNKREHELVLNIFPKTHTCWHAPAHFALPNILQTQFTWYDCRFPKHCVCVFFFSPATEEKLQDIRGGPKPETLEMKVTSRVMWPGESLLYSATGAGIKSFVFFVSRYSHYIIIFIMLDFVNTVDSRVEDGEVGAELNVQTRKWFISDQAKKKTSQQSSNIFQIATGCHVYCDAGKQMHLVGLK